MKKIFLLLMTFLILGCAKKDFTEGSCVISPDGFTWRINKIQDDKYIAEKWQGNSWENETSLGFGNVSLSNGFGTVACPKKNQI